MDIDAQLETITNQSLKRLFKNHRDSYGITNYAGFNELFEKFAEGVPAELGNLITIDSERLKIPHESTAIRNVVFDMTKFGFLARFSPGAEMLSIIFGWTIQFSRQFISDSKIVLTPSMLNTLSTQYISEGQHIEYQAIDRPFLGDWNTLIGHKIVLSPNPINPRIAALYYLEPWRSNSGRSLYDCAEYCEMSPTFISVDTLQIGAVNITIYCPKNDTNSLELQFKTNISTNAIKVSSTQLQDVLFFKEPLTMVFLLVGDDDGKCIQTWEVGELDAYPTKIEDVNNPARLVRAQTAKKYMICDKDFSVEKPEASIFDMEAETGEDYEAPDLDDNTLFYHYFDSSTIPTTLLGWLDFVIPDEHQDIEIRRPEK